MLKQRDKWGEIHTPFIEAGAFMPPVLLARGDTPLGEAITTGLKMLEDRKAIIRENGVALFRPWILVITDGVRLMLGSTLLHWFVMASRTSVSPSSP